MKARSLEEKSVKKQLLRLNNMSILKEKRRIRRKKIRAKISGTKSRPRLSVFRSDRYIYAQLVDDQENKVILAVNDLKLDKERKVERGKEVGKLVAQKAKELGVKEIVFDRSGYKYHGRVKAVAEGAREGGLKF